MNHQLLIEDGIQRAKKEISKNIWRMIRSRNRGACVAYVDFLKGWLESLEYWREQQEGT